MELSDLTRPAGLCVIPAWIDDHPGSRLMVILRAPGCHYARQSGGCTNCGFQHLTTRGEPVSAELLLEQLRFALDHPPAHPHPFEEIDLYCSGSFFCDEEIPPEARAALLRLCATRSPAIQTVLVDSRPEYVTVEVLRAAQIALERPEQPAPQLEVAIGLESADDTIRQQHIRKGFSRASFERAAANLAQYGAGLVVYLLLKPLGLSEEEAREDVLESGRYLHQLGQRLSLPIRVALEPLFVVEGTAVFEAFRAGRYVPPSLWTVLHATHDLAALLPVQVGLDTEGLPAEHVPAGCARCTHWLRETLTHFNQTQDQTILQHLTCPCQTKQKGDTAPSTAP